MSERTTRVTLSFDAPVALAAGLAYAAQMILTQRGCSDFERAYDPEPPQEYGVSADEAARRRIHGPPLRP